MTDKKLPQIQQNTSVNSVLERSKSLMTVTQKVLQKAKAAKELAKVDDDSWMERLWAWADLNHVPDYKWVKNKYHDEGGYWRGLPRDKNKLRNLTELLLKNNQLTSLPPEIGQMRNLTELSLYNNQLTSLPPEIGQLRNLSVLHLDINQLTSLPPEIGQLRNLTKLDLGLNQLTSLPPEIVQLRNLTQLFLWDNPLTSLPPEIGQLNKLETLDLEGNPLTQIPESILKLPNLDERSRQFLAKFKTSNRQPVKLNDFDDDDVPF